MNITKHFEKLRVQLLYSQPGYALMLQRCKVVWPKGIKTAGVRPTADGRVELGLSAEYLGSLSENHGVGVIMHEMLHLFFDHFRRGKRLNQRVANIAMDCAINQYIPKKNLHPDWLLPEKFGLPNGEGFEFYYIALMEKTKQDPQSVQGETTDNHDWSQSEPTPGEAPSQGESQPAQSSQGTDGNGKPNEGTTEGKGNPSPALSEEIKKSVVENLVREAHAEAKKKYPGKVPAHFETLIEGFETTPVLDWRAQLRQFVGRERSREVESTRTRPNRRQGFLAQGNKATYFPKILVGLDESGSVSPAMHRTLLAELRQILKNADGATEVAFFDTAIAHKATLRRAGDLKAKRYSHGGTDFDCVFEYANDVRPDLIIILTDGYAPAPQVQLRRPVLWVIAGDNDGKHLQGTKVFLPETEGV